MMTILTSYEGQQGDHAGVSRAPGPLPTDAQQKSPTKTGVVPCLGAYMEFLSGQDNSDAGTSGSKGGAMPARTPLSLIRQTLKTF